MCIAQSHFVLQNQSRIIWKKFLSLDKFKLQKLKIFENKWKSGVEDEFSYNFANENIPDIQTKIAISEKMNLPKMP